MVDAAPLGEVGGGNRGNANGLREGKVY